jgi:hypothetical protein
MTFGKLFRPNEEHMNKKVSYRLIRNFSLRSFFIFHDLQQEHSLFSFMRRCFSELKIIEMLIRQEKLSMEKISHKEY